MKFGILIGHDADFDGFTDVGNALLDGDVLIYLLPTLIGIMLLAMVGIGKRAIEDQVNFFFDRIYMKSPI